jgi:RNA polymerase sigma-70 factor (ECF subfamily)
MGASTMWMILWEAFTVEPDRPGQPAGPDRDDGTLVAAFKQGQVQAFDVLFARYRRPLFGYIYRSVGDAALAEELTQDVFLKAFLYLRRTAATTIFKAWIYRIATTTCIDAQRAAARRPIPVYAETALPRLADHTDADPEQRQIRRERRRAVRDTLDDLPAHYRQALILRQLQGLTYAEIAEVLGISVEAVTSLIHRARWAFRAAYGRRQEETDQ